MMERAALERMIGRLKALPTPSVVHSRLAALLADPDCTFAEVSATVGLDQVLTAELFRAVNTPRPAATRISTVMQAVRLAGFGTLGALVSAQPIVPESADDGADARGLWRHALAVAIASRAIAAQTRYQDPEECYAAGLLHDIGKHVMRQYFRDKFDAVSAEAEQLKTTFYRCEVESGEASHAVIGRMLAKEWSLAIRHVDAIGWHHTPQLATTHPHIVAIVHLGDIMARALGLGDGGDPFVPPVNTQAVLRLNIQPAQVATIMATIEREFALSAGIFDS